MNVLSSGMLLAKSVKSLTDLSLAELIVEMIRAVWRTCELKVSQAVCLFHTSLLLITFFSSSGKVVSFLRLCMLFYILLVLPILATYALFCAIFSFSTCTILRLTQTQLHFMLRFPVIVSPSCSSLALLPFRRNRQLLYLF